jgi:undecaprenyl-diphosphatase
MDYRIFRAVNEFARDHTWLAHATYGFETIGVVLYAAAVLLLWLATAPGEERRWKFAALSGAASAGLALLLNQLIGRAWHRPRPYQRHAHVYHLTSTRDPSFPSDHASAAFGIAFAVLLFDRVVGGLFLVAAVLIGAGRVFVGAHYPTDVLAGCAVGLACAVLVVRVARPLLTACVRLVERVTDPLVAPAWRTFGRR